MNGLAFNAAAAKAEATSLVAAKDEEATSLAAANKGKEPTSSGEPSSSGAEPALGVPAGRGEVLNPAGVNPSLSQRMPPHSR